MINACIDIETLSTRATAVVLSIGICFFDDEKQNTFEDLVAGGTEIFFCQAAQKDRHVLPSTVEWWAQQGDAARRVLEATATVEPRAFHTHLEAFCAEREMNYNWVKSQCRWYSRGNAFDIAIIDNLFADHNVATPWKYYKVRCIRTWLECHGLSDNTKLIKPSGMTAHNALHDAAFDAWMMQQVLHTPHEQLAIDNRKDRMLIL